MSKYPSDWLSKPLGKVYPKIVVGYVGNVNDHYCRAEEGVPFYRTLNIRDGYFRHSEHLYVTHEFNEKNKKSQITNNDILIARVGANLGMVCKANGISGLANMANAIIIKTNDVNSADADFYTSFLLSPMGKNQIYSGAAGGAQGVFNTKLTQEIIVPVPPLPEQRKIAQILSTWDRGIATTEKLIDASKQQKKALMQQLLTGKKRLGYDEGTYTFKKTRYGAIPTDWAYPAIKDIAVQISEKNSKGLDLPVLSCSKYDGFVDSLKYFKKKVYSDDTSGYRVISKGCFGFPANHIEEGSIGLQNLYEKGIVSPIYVVFQAKKNLVENRYLYALLKTDHYRQIFSAATNASVDRRGSLRWKEFSAIHVSLPPLEEQKAIADVLELADKEIELLEAKLAHFKQEKKALMQQLLTGKRRVKVTETEVA
ncbi:restriction endonuclease subunit S [Photobacterium leiognathi]|uniref:restriction endonuclease subunit S n=1 Tax=Photobacterium leiognathi TaxID=553611 RepID=UPI0029829099|nr:restriction endonuclease subunit S [Photobacterium leiognathi]